MSKTMKWTLGILAFLVILAAVLVTSAIIFGRLGNSGWEMDARRGRLWHDDLITPWDNNEKNQDQWQEIQPDDQSWQYMPWHRMPRAGMPGFNFFQRPLLRMPGISMGFFSPLRMAGLPLMCLCLFGVLALGGIVLVINARRSPKQAVNQPVAASPAPEPAPAPSEQVEAKPAPEIRTCGSCGREADSEWGHCPYCGSPLA